MAASARNVAWFLGAGTSAAAGIPTGYDMILDFKTRLFCSATRTPRREIDPIDPLWNQRITSYFDNDHGLPANGAPEEYAVAFEAVFPKVDERRRYIEELVRRGQPTFGHRLLAAMIASGQTPCLFTTNFDQLVERSATVADELLPVGDRTPLVVAALDSAGRARRCVNESAWPLLVKLHGDYHSTRLMNTTAELQGQDTNLRRVLADVSNRFGLVVVGYSGRDQSVMESLIDTLEGPSPFPAGLRWIVRSGQKPLQAVAAFLDRARDAGVDVRLVEAETFDELAADVDRQIDLPDKLAAHVLTARPRPVTQPVVLSERVEAGAFPALRCSALPVLALPQTARRLRLGLAVTTPDARKALNADRFRGILAARAHEVAAFGADEDLLSAFKPWGAELDGEVHLDPHVDSWAFGLIYDALVRSLTRGRPLRPILRRAGHAVVVARPSPNRAVEARERDVQRLRPLQQAYRQELVGSVPSTDLPFAEAVRIRLENHDGRWWCVFDPFTWVDYPRRDTAPGETARESIIKSGGDPTVDWRRERWARRYNPNWSAMFDAWSGLLVSGREDTIHAVGIRGRNGVDASFTLSASTAWCRPGRSDE